MRCLLTVVPDVPRMECVRLQVLLDSTKQAEAKLSQRVSAVHPARVVTVDQLQAETTAQANEALAAARLENVRLHGELKARDTEVASLKETNRSKDAELSALRAAQENKDTEVVRLKDVLTTLERELGMLCPNTACDMTTL